MQKILIEKYEVINNLYQDKNKLKKFLTNECKFLLTKNPSDDINALVLFDLAYIDFAEKDYCKISLEYDNVISFKTFSKAMALPSIRCGYCISNKDNIVSNELSVFKNIFNLINILYLKSIDKILELFSLYIKKKKIIFF